MLQNLSYFGGRLVRLYVKFMLQNLSYFGGRLVRLYVMIVLVQGV